MSGPSLDLSFSNKDHIVRAGAGAGKTYNLVACVYEAYLHFKSLEGGKNPRFILTTFTRKATQELRERMVLKACEVQDEEFFNFVTDSNFLSISTIHGVLGQFLKEFGHLFQMDLSFNILEGEDENNLLESVARELVLEEEGSFRWLDEFGMYKLSGMLRSFHFHFGKNPNLRAPTFEEAFEHTEDYVFRRKQELLDLVDEGLRVVTDEPYLKSLLSIKEFLEAWEIGVELELPALARKAKRETFPLGLHEVLMPKISQFKKQLKEIVTDSDELRKLTQQWEEFFQFATKFSDKVKEKKREKGAVTLSDLENQVADILRQSPFLGKIFSDNFDYWLIDEFQDTSSHQLDILNQLIGDRPRFVVGDPQQSIYLFRGAEAQIFSQEWGRVGRESGRTSKLELNYRSQRELLYFFNEVMGQCPQFSPMEAHHDRLSPGQVAHFIQGEDFDDELRGIFLRVLEICGESRDWDRICVLGRTHMDLFKVASYLKSKGVPTHVHSPQGFGSRREIQDALSIYKFLINSHDDLNLLQALRAPWLKVSDKLLVEWMNTKTSSLWNFLVELPNPPTPVQVLSKCKDGLKDWGLIKSFTDLLKEIHFIEKSSSFDPSGRVEANVWKFIAKLKDLERQPGSHPLEIMNSLNEESDAIAATEPNCVNLMTIHGSKGLEFDHVIFPRLGRPFQLSKRGQMAFSEDSSSFVFSQKDEDDFALVSAMEKDWIELRRVREREEVERWFYVALTRARLSVTLTWNQNELTENSWVGLFNLLKFESDSSLRRLGPFEEHQELASSEPLEAPRSPYKRQEASDDLERSRASFSKMSSDENIRWTHKSLRNKYASQAKGIHWHRLFESLKFSGVEDGLKEFPFLNNLKTPPLKEVISSGHVEWGFQSKVNSKVIEGQIDLWGFDKKGHLWVIDYKTGSLKSKEKAILQVQFYLWVLKHGQLAQKDFHWAVIYPFEEKVLSGEMTTEDFINLEVELGLSQ